MTDKEIKFTVDLDELIRPAIFGVLALFAARVALAVCAVSIVSLTGGNNVWACLAIFAMAFGSLFTDASISLIIGYYSATKGWLGQTILLTCVGLILAGAIFYFC